MKAKIDQILGPNTVRCGKKKVRVPINVFRPLKVGNEIDVPDSEVSDYAEPEKKQEEPKK